MRAEERFSKSMQESRKVSRKLGHMLEDLRHDLASDPREFLYHGMLNQSVLLDNHKGSI